MIAGTWGRRVGTFPSCTGVITSRRLFSDDVMLCGVTEIWMNRDSQHEIIMSLVMHYHQHYVDNIVFQIINTRDKDSSLSDETSRVALMLYLIQTPSTWVNKHILQNINIFLNKLTFNPRRIWYMRNCTWSSVSFWHFTMLLRSAPIRWVTRYLPITKHCHRKVYQCFLPQ